MARKSHRIIVEGMDGSGKTTLITELHSRIPSLQTIVNLKNDKQNFEQWWPQVLDEPDESPFIPIHDRFFYSELVYGQVIRGKINAGHTLITNVLWFLRSTSLLIYARPHSDILREGMEKHPQMDGVRKYYHELLSTYDQLMEAERDWFGDRLVQYVWNREGEYDRIEEIIREYLAN